MDSLTPFMYTGLAVATCCAMSFPCLESFRKQREIQDIFHAAAHFSLPRKTLWGIAIILIVLVVSEAYHNLIYALINIASALGGPWFSEVLEIVTGKKKFNRIAYILLSACMGLATLVWLLRIDIRRQAPDNEAAA